MPICTFTWQIASWVKQLKPFRAAYVLTVAQGSWIFQPIFNTFLQMAYNVENILH
jgi:hypothetical protein